MEAMEESTVASLPLGMKLLEFPDEVLSNIMLHLNEPTLLYMTRVCKRFKAIAKEAFTKKYNGRNENQYFKVNIFPENLTVERKQYQPLFCTFGEKMVAIDLCFDAGPVAQDHWIFSLIQRFCTKLSKIEIAAFDHIDLLRMFRSLPSTTMTHIKLSQADIQNTHWSQCRFPNLIRFHIENLGSYVPMHIFEFISTHSQLQEIHLEAMWSYSYLPYFEEIGNRCQDIRKLEIIHCTQDTGLWDDETIDMVCEHGTTLNWLGIEVKGLKLSQLETLVQGLPNLSTLILYRADVGTEIYENLSQAVSICEEIPQLKIQTKFTGVSKINFELLAHIADDIMQANKTVVLEDGKDEIVIVKGVVRRNKTVVYEHNADHMESATHFLDLNDKCLLRIIEFSKPNQHCALYDTCQRTRKAIENYYSENSFSAHFDSNELDESILSCLGKEIKSMKLKRYSFLTRNAFDELWGRINQYCTNLKELVCFIIDTDQNMDPVNCVWPKLEKLIFSTYSHNCIRSEPSSCSVSYETLRSFSGPSLTHLEVISLQNDVLDLDHGDHFRHLTVLKFGHYNESVKKFFLALDDNICEQMQQLSIGSYLAGVADDNRFERFIKMTKHRLVVELINIVSRFRKLTILQLIVPGVERSDTKYLFENCTDLMQFGVWCNGEFLSEEIFKHVKKNCLQIGTIQLFGLRICEKVVQKLRQILPDVSIEVSTDDNVVLIYR